jgi:hypothetical protein
LPIAFGGFSIPRIIDASKRVFVDSPPVIYRPNLEADISGFSTTQELMVRAAGEGSSGIPFEKELALYLLLIASLWPDDRDRLLTAARLFAGGLNWSVENQPHRRQKYLEFRKQFPRSKLISFNETFFQRIGGPYSLVFCKSVSQFHEDVWNRIGELTVLHDVIEFLFKASALSQRFSSLSFAFHAIAHNVFGRRAGYGVSSGPKRGPRDGIAWKTGAAASQVITVNSIRQKWRNRPDTLVLSFVLMKFWPMLSFLPPSNRKFFLQLSRLAHHDAGATIKNFLPMVELALSGSAAMKQSHLAQLTTSNIQQKWPKRLRVTPLSDDELERAISAGQTYFQRSLSDAEQEQLRQKLKGWWR